jgi:hypothetical protein
MGGPDLRSGISSTNLRNIVFSLVKCSGMRVKDLTRPWFRCSERVKYSRPPLIRPHLSKATPLITPDFR